MTTQNSTTPAPRILVAHNGDMLIEFEHWNVRIEFDERPVVYQEMGDGGSPDCPHCGAAWDMGPWREQGFSAFGYRIVDRDSAYVDYEWSHDALVCNLCGKEVATWVSGWNYGNAPKEPKRGEMVTEGGR